MSRITPLKYKDLIAKKITITKIQDISARNIKLVTVNFLDNSTRKYNNKPVSIWSGKYSIEGKFIITSKIVGGVVTETTAIEIPAGNLKFNIELNTEYIIYETFDIRNDIECLTAQDIYERFKTLPSDMFDIDEEYNSGQPGLLDGSDKQKLDLFSNHVLAAKNITVGKWDEAPVEVGVLKLTHFDSYNIIFSDGTNKTDFNIIANNNGNSVVVQVLSVIGEPYQIKITKQSFSDNTAYLLLEASKTTDSKQMEYYVTIRNISDIVKSVATVTNNTEMLFNNKSVLTLSDKLLFSHTDSSMFGIETGETEFQKQKQLLNKIQTLTHGYWYRENTIDEVSDKPVGVTTRYNLYKGGQGNFDFYYLIDSKSTVFYGYEDGNQIVWSQISVDGHKHSVDDITETDEKQFISKEQLEILENLAELTRDSSWRPFVLNKTALNNIQNPVAGWSVVVLNDADYGNQTTMYLFNGSSWIPASSNTLEAVTSTKSGLMTPDMLKQLNAAGVLKRTGTNIVLSGNPDALYSDDTIDITDRQPTDLPISKNSVNIGKEINVKESGVGIGSKISNADIAIGEGLDNDGGIILGKHNQKLNPGYVFGIGWGTASEKKTIFQLDQNGTALINKLLINGKDNTDVVLAGGATVKLDSFVTQEEFQGFSDKFAENTTNVYEEFETVTGSKYKVYPIMTTADNFDDGEEE